ncbi:hypothetical protein [Clostridium beijerinckii]|nr:hypothetical protein [Clostridium beijerinckii]
MSILKKTGIMTMPEELEEMLVGHSVLVVGHIDGHNPTRITKGCLIFVS